jgi:hypothetical protein
MQHGTAVRYRLAMKKVSKLVVRKETLRRLVETEFTRAVGGVTTSGDDSKAAGTCAAAAPLSAVVSVDGTK